MLIFSELNGHFSVRELLTVEHALGDDSDTDVPLRQARDEPESTKPALLRSTHHSPILIHGRANIAGLLFGIFGLAPVVEAFDNDATFGAHPTELAGLEMTGIDLFLSEWPPKRPGWHDEFEKGA